MDLDFQLHEKQMLIFESEARFRVVAAGRRFGKSYLSAVELLIHALQDTNRYGYDITTKEVWYVAPTFQQGKDIMWSLLKALGQDVIESQVENTGTLRLINGRKIQIKGSDRPDTLRGVGISFVVLDEYAFMKPSVWEEIIRPTLSDVKGDALFIGTPDGKNHFYELFIEADKYDDWEAFSFGSIDNPTLDPLEILTARNTMSESAFRQEYEASFQSEGSGIFKSDMLKYKDEPADGVFYVAVDPAGFADVHTVKKSKLKRLDETAIAVVKVNHEGWWVKEIQHGRWGIRETALRILRAAQSCQASAIGIEGGALKNAIMPYLEEKMRQLNYYPRILSCTHGGTKKATRITWALQGRFEHGRISFNPEAKGKDWFKRLVDQLLDFPNPMVHDDLLDALAYIDQIAVTNFPIDSELDEWEPLDVISGF